MVNPGNAARYFPSEPTANLADRQRVNFYGSDQGYDSYGSSNNLDYDASLNVDPAATGAALVLQPGQTAVKARSVLTGLVATARPAVAELCALTCVSSAPAANSFRPGFAGVDKSTFAASAINLAALPNLSGAGISVPAYATALSWLSQIHTHQHTYNVLSRNIVPAIPGASSPANDVYAGTFMERFGEIALGLCLNVWTTPQKTELARRLVQHAIDIEARAAEGGIWQDNGGHAAGRGALLAICALLTGRQSMADMVGQAVVGVMDTPANASPLGTRIWGDVSQHGLITQAIIDTARAMPFTQSQLGWPEFAADAARRSISEPTNWQNSLGAAQPTDLKQAYRHVATAVNVPFGLALRLISGGRALFDSQVYFDYLDRHMQVRIAAGATLPDAVGNDIAPWVMQAWQAHRGTSGLWQAPALPTAPSNTTLPSISGTAQVGSVLTSTPGEWTGTAPVTLTYQWRRNGSAISGATGTTYTIVSGDIGAVITVAVTGTNTAGSSAPAVSNDLGPVANPVVAPSNTIAPSISGTTQVGSELASTPGEWTGTSPITLIYQWRRNGVAISGATGTSYALVSADIGATITLIVTANNVAGSSAPAVSSGLGPVTDVSAPATPLAGTRSIAFGPRNGDGFQNRLAGPQLTNLFGTGSAGAAGALAVRVRIQPGGLNSTSSATSQTIVVSLLGTGGTTVSRGVHAGFGSYGSSFTGLRGRFYFLGRDQAGANYVGDRDTAGNPGATGSVRYLRSPQITPNAQGSWTGLVILRRDGAGQFQVLLVTADGTVQLGDTFTPAAWLGSTLTSGALSLGSFTGAPLTFGNWFPGDVCDLIQLDGASGSDANWQAVALGANPATVFGANLAAHYRLAGTGDLTQTAGSRSYAAFTLAQSDAANRPIIDGPQLRPARNGAGAALLAAPQFPGYVHAVAPAGVRAAANRAAVKALTGSVVRDVLVTGAATHVQGRALTPGGTQLVGWTRVTAAATTGLVETILPGVPVGEVVLEYRREDDPSVIAVVCDRERVGLVVSLIGQSQTQIAMGDATSVTLSPNLNTSVSYCWMRGGGTGWNPPDGGFLDRQRELSEGMTAAARMLDALGTDIPVEFLCVAQQGTSIAQLMYRYSGDGLDLCGDGSDPQSGMLTSMMLAKRKRITGWLFSWATSDASSRNGGSVPIGATPYGARGPLTERPWVERMNEFFGGVEKSTADATERSERRNLHDLGFAAAWNPWVIMLPVSRHRFNSAGAASVDTTFGAFRQQQYDLAVAGAGKAGAWEIDLGAFQIDTFMPDGESAHQDRTDPRGNIRFCLRYAQALAFAGKLSTLDPRPAFTSATRSGSVITLATDLRNGGSLVPQTDGATLEEFEVSEDGGATWSRRDGAVPFTPAISGSLVTLTRGSGSWAANTRVRYLAGWPVAVGGTTGMAATEGTRLNGVLYETRTDAIPSGIVGLRAGVPLMPMWSPLIAA